MFNTVKKGNALLIVLGLTALMVLVSTTLKETGISTRKVTYRTENEQKTIDFAEAVTNLVYRKIAEEMNDPQMIYDLIKLKGLNLESWFWKFRLPQFTAGGNVDPMKFKNDNISYAQTSGNDLGFELSIGPEMLAKLRKTYTIKDFPELEELYRDFGGNINVKSVASIKKVYGILPKSNTIEIPGITINTKFLEQIVDKNIAKFLNSLLSDEKFELDLTEHILKYVPDVNLGDIIQNAIKNLNFNLALWGTAVPIPVGRLVGAFLKGVVTRLGQGSPTLKNILRNTILKDLKLSLDLTSLKNSIRNKVMSIFPDEFNFFAGKLHWGVTVEKIGVFEVKTEVEYRPQGESGPVIRKTLITQKDFRVADIQPIAPRYTFFVANSKLLFEDESVENTNNFKGDEVINWNEGMGSLICHNIGLTDSSTFNKLKNFMSALFSLDIEKMANNFFLPGLVRVNGTKKMEVRLNFGLLDFIGGNASFIDCLKGCEVFGLLLGHKDPSTHSKTKGEHPIMPSMGESIYGSGKEGVPPLGGWIAFFNILEGQLEKFGLGKDKLSLSSFLQVPKNALSLPYFDWPWLTNGKMWVPIPQFYNKTYFFGDLHIEAPLSLRIEGNIWKRFSRVRLPMIRIFIPLNWLFGCPNVDITLPPLPMQENIVEPYGFCAYPPIPKSNGEADEQAMAKAWDPNDHANLPANIYTPVQYLKKASYYYATSADFNNDIENRSTEMDVPGVGKKKVFNCDGVTFVECTDGQGLFFRDDLWVCGRGIIVAAGNIHLKSIRRVDPPDGPPTILSIIARNGAIINKGNNVVEACLYGDRGLMNPIYGKLKIYGNLVVNQFNRKDCQGTVEIFYESNRTHSSVLSYFSDFAKFDPTRYHVSFSKRWRQYEIAKN